jgi:hypothetical protein
MRPAFVLLIALRLAAAADSSVGAFFPTDTKAVIGIRLQALGAAGLFQGMDTEIRKSAAGMFEKSPLAGFDPLKDLDEVLIATTGTGEKPPAILVLRGRFPLDKLDAGTKRYRDAAFLESPNPQQSSAIIALINANTAILGDAEQVIAAIDRASTDANANAPWLARMEALRAKCSIWGFGEGLESLAGPEAKPGDLSSIDRFEFGVAFEKGLKLAAEIHVRTPQDAEKLSASLKLVEAMMKGPKKTAKNTGFTMRADDNGTLKLSLILPEAEMKKAMQEERGALMAAISSGMPALMSSRQMKAMVPQAEAPAPVQYRPAVPADAVQQTNSEGDTVVLTLPGNIPAKP